MELHVGSHVDKWHCWSDVDFKYKRSSVKPHAVQSYKESTAAAAAAYSREQRTQADVRFPAASSDSTFQRCLFIGDKLKLFTHHLHPPFVCGLAHLLNYKVFQRREMQWSGLLLGIKNMSDWVGAHTHAQPTDLQMEIPFHLLCPEQIPWGVWTFTFFSEFARDWVWRTKTFTELMSSSLKTFL